MTEEKEILTILSYKEYKTVIAKLKKEFGEPEKVERLSLQATDYRWADVDTRIRITNGKAEIMQKVGDWKKTNRQEISVPLPNNAKTIFDAYQIFLNAMKDDRVLTPIIQLENLLFKSKDFEIKLTHQFGKKDAYNCEIEVFNLEMEPRDLSKKYNIPIHLPDQTRDFWKKWNETVNLSARDLPSEEILKIIQKYL